MSLEGIRQATKNDIEWIVSQEQRDDFKLFFGSWSQEKHEQNLNDADKLYLIAIDETGQSLAFLILAGLSSKARNIELVRMAVSRPGEGIGKLLLKELIHMAFSKLDANRLWFEVFDDNYRARHTYKKVGFSEEDLQHEAVLKRDGQLGSLIIMSIIAKEYCPDSES